MLRYRLSILSQFNEKPGDPLFSLLIIVPLPGPPAAPRKEHRELRHGKTVVDEFYWLREKSNPEVIQYLEAENEYTAAKTKHLEPFVESLYQEMLGRIKQTDLSVPVRRGEYFYYLRTEEGKQYPIRCRKQGKMDAPEEVLLDLNELAAGHAYVGLGDFEVNDDQDLLAYTLDYSGFRQFGLYVKNLLSGELLPGTVERVTSVAWAADNRTLFVTTEDAITKRSNTLWRYRIGESASELVYEEPDELYEVHLDKTRDRRFLFLAIESTDTTEVHYLAAAEPDSEFLVFMPREAKHRYYLDYREGLFYIRTNRDAKDFCVMTAPVADLDPRNWRTFIPHRAGKLIEDIDLFKNFAVALEKSEALNHFRVYEFSSENWKGMDFPDPVYSAGPGENPDYESTCYRYTYQSFITPRSVYDYDALTGTSVLLKQEEVLGGYDTRNYVSERLWATSRDGAKIPLSIAYKKGFHRNGARPLLLYGYGSYGIGMSASFSSSRLSLLDRGVAYVIAHIRGGDELGEQWREDGMLMKKKNTFFDFIDSAEYLIGEQWTAPERLLIEGRSAGGLLMGAVVNMRPDLFRAVHAGVPFLDVMNTMMDASLPLTVGEYLEWGNPNKKEAYDYMRSYSPYDNLKPTNYPAILITTSLNDSQVMYWEPAKYVARLRSLNTGSNEILLRIHLEPAGHGGASGRYERLKEVAFEYAWLLSKVGIVQ